MIEALWIDDECMSNGVLTAMGVEFIETAYKHGIKVTPVLTYKEGIDMIDNNHLQWCAVILDIHNQKATRGMPSDDFDEAREQIIRIQTKYGQQEPYIFVLSGNEKYKECPTIRRPNYCQKNIYDKNGQDYELLFSDIVKIQSLSKLYACQEEYQDVLIIAKQINEKVYVSLLQLLYNIMLNGEKKNADLFTRMRKILEIIKDKLEEYGYKYFTETNEEICLNGLSRYIGQDKNIPEYIQRAFHTLTRVVQDGSHCSADMQHRLMVDKDVSNLKAPYLLRSSIYELCNILIWIGEKYIYVKND